LGTLMDKKNNDVKVPIGPGAKVKLTFSVMLDSGEVVDSTGVRTVEFVVGDGNLLPGFECAMFGLRTGDKKRISISPEDGFGETNTENVHRFKRTEFKVNMELAEGLMMSFADAQNTELPGVIVGVSDDFVDVDFNHPLAGKNLIFEVDIHSVEQVTNEILRVSN